MGTTVLIAGCGRSGTTFLRTLLDAHPDIYIPSESLFIIDYLKYAHHVPQRLRTWLFFNEPQLRAWYQGPTWQFGHTASAIRRVHQHEARRQGAVLWGQKTPRFIREMPLFDHAFDDTKWILMYRDPRAVAASMLRSTRHTYSIAQACRRWKNDNRPIVRIMRGENDAHRTCIIKYEELILNYNDTMRRIFQFLDVRPQSAAALARNVRWPELRGSRFRDNAMRTGLDPQPDLIDTWQRLLKPHEIDYIQRRCSRQMRLLGYDPIQIPLNTTPTYLNTLNPIAIKDALILFEYLKNWPQYLVHTALRKFVMKVCNAIRTMVEKIEIP